MDLSSDERNWAMAALLGPLIIGRTKGQTMPFVAEQAKESLNFSVPFCLRLVK